MAEGNVLKEFLYKLGFKVDGAEVAGKSVSTMDSTIKNLALSVGKLALKFFLIKKAISATTKYIKDNVKYTLSMNDTLEAQAKKLKKTTEQARAHLIALKMMGKTMEEIKKDKNLKARYNELIKLGEAMQLPQGANGIRVLDGLKTAFAKLQVAGQYVFQWIWYYWQQYVQKPIEALTGYINDIVELIKKNVQPVSKKVGEFIAKVIKEAIKLIKDAIVIVKTIINVIHGVYEAFKNLPPQVQALIIAVTALFTLIKSKTALVRAIFVLVILLIDDLIVYLDGGKSAFSNLWDMAISGALIFYNSLVAVYNVVIDVINGVKWFMNLFRSNDNKLEMSAKMEYYTYEDGKLTANGSGIGSFVSSQIDNTVDVVKSGAAAIGDVVDLFSGDSEASRAVEGNATPGYAISGGVNTDNSTTTTTINVTQNITGTDANAIASAATSDLMGVVQENLAPAF